MTTLIKAAKEIRATIQGNGEQVTEKSECNYTDNYYGDQVCFLVKSNP